MTDIYPRDFIGDLGGKPLDNGAIYVGVANQDPQANPVQCYWDAALTVPASQPISVYAGYPVNSGTRADVYTASSSYSIRVRDKSGAQVDYIASVPNGLLGSSGAGSVGFSNSATYSAGTVGKSLQDKGVSVTDAPYLADRTGAADCYAAFTAAIAASSLIIVPAGTYKLLTQPVWTDSIEWRISPLAVFTGAGTGAGKFPYMNTNTAQMAVGPFIQSQSHQKSTNVNGGIAAFNVEMIQPIDYGAGQSVGLFAGGRMQCATAGANVWAANFVLGVLGTAVGTGTVLELDADTNSASATVKGLAITGGGTANADVGIEISRAAMAWDIGISLTHATDAIVVTGNTGGRGLVLHAPSATVAGVAGAAVSARQYANAGDTIVLQRNTDTTPTGDMVRVVNAANSATLARISAAGDGTFQGLTVAALAMAAGLNNYANDAAAAAGGISLYQFYRNGSVVMQRVV